MNTETSEQLRIIDRILINIDAAPKFVTVDEYCADMDAKFRNLPPEITINMLNISDIIDTVIDIQSKSENTVQYRNALDKCVYNCPRLARKVRLV